MYDDNISDEYLDALDDYYCNLIWVNSLECIHNYKENKMTSIIVNDTMINILTETLEEIRMRSSLSDISKQVLIRSVLMAYMSAIRNIIKEVSI